MRDSIKYSVIIPFYNAEESLRRCLDSLKHQVREDIEIILVNDGSQDGSEGIALEYVGENSVFRLINQKNAGVSCARNTGLEAAQGRYITFVDSDDYVRQDYFSILDENEDCDLLVFCHEVIGYDPRNMSKLFAALQNKKTFEERFELLLTTRRIMSPWDKRFRKSIIDGNRIRFPEGMHIGEDFNFCMAYAVRCRDIGIETEQILYNDITGMDSLSRKYRPDLDRQMLDVFNGVVDTLRHSSLPQESKCRLMAITDYLFVKHVFSCISEKFKVGEFGFFRNRSEIAGICRSFQTPLTHHRCGVVHVALRLLLSMRFYFLFYLVSYIKKGRSFVTQVRGNG